MLKKGIPKEDKIIELKTGDLFYFCFSDGKDSYPYTEDECFVFLEYKTPTVMTFYSQKKGEYADWDVTSVYRALASSQKYLKVYQDGEDITEYLLSELKKEKALWKKKVDSMRYNPLSLFLIA